MASVKPQRPSRRAWQETVENGWRSLSSAKGVLPDVPVWRTIEMPPPDGARKESLGIGCYNDAAPTALDGISENEVLGREEEARVLEKSLMVG